MATSSNNTPLESNSNSLPTTFNRKLPLTAAFFLLLAGLAVLALLWSFMQPPPSSTPVPIPSPTPLILVANPQEQCESLSGKYLPNYAECEDISQTDCDKLGGQFNECASSCRHNPNTEVCIMMCVPVCQINTATTPQPTKLLCTNCPEFTPPAPDFCKNGKIALGKDIDFGDCYCPAPPTCLLPKSPTPSSKSTKQLK